MYASESAVFLSGHFFVACKNNSLVAANENENLPSSPVHPMSLSSALNIQTILREMVRDGKGQKIPDRIVDVVTESALRAVKDIDTAWARSIVSGYYQVSKPLGLDLEKPSFKEQLKSNLLARLNSDLKTESLHFSSYRFSSVNGAFKAMGEEMTHTQVGDVMNNVYDRFVETLQSSKGNLHEVTEDSNRLIGVIEHAYQLNR